MTILNLFRFLSRHAFPRRRALRAVIWSGHSHGRYAGSAAYCDSSFDELSEHAVLNINVDCLGGEAATLLSLSPAMASSAELAAFALSCGADFEHWQGTRFSRACDQSFRDTGLPSLFSQVSELPPATGVAAEAFGALFGSTASGGYGSWWHTAEDTPAHVSEANLLRNASVSAAATLSAAAAETLPLNAQTEVVEGRMALERRTAAVESFCEEALEKLDAHRAQLRSSS